MTQEPRLGYAEMDNISEAHLGVTGRNNKNIDNQKAFADH